MSLLLDALNKADQERKRGDGPPSIDSRHDMYKAHDRSTAPTLIIVLGAGIVLIILLAAVYWLGMRTQQVTTDPSVKALQQPFAAQNTQINTISNNQKNSVSEKKSGSEKNSDSAKDSDSKHVTINDSSRVENAPADEGVANLYQQQMTNNPMPAITGSNTNPSEIIFKNTNDISTTQETSPSPTSIKQFANLPELNDLPSNILEKIPTLKYSEHNYNQNGGSVVVNGTVKHVNDELAKGVVIDKILSDGIILHFENYSFKMRALNTWINM